MLVNATQFTSIYVSSVEMPLVGELICVGSVSTTTPNVFEDDDNPHPALL
jgi:hypothetical protein